MANRYNVLAVNDDKDFCECCGKQGLQRVVWIEDLDTGEIKHFGTTCATKPAKGFGVDKEIKAAIGYFNDKRKAQFFAAHRAYKAAGGKYGPMQADGTFPRLDAALYEKCLAEVKKVLT